MNRTIPCVLLVVSLFLAQLACSADAPTPAGWPAWRGPKTDGLVSWLPDALPASKPTPVWQAKVAGDCAAGIGVAEGVVVVADNNEEKDFYRCFDAEKGTELWVREFPNDRKMDYGNAPRATPLIQGGKVYVLSAFGELYCFDLKTGKTVWQKEYTKDYQIDEPPTWGFSSSPLIVDGKLIINPGGGDGFGVVALDPADGKLIWKGLSNGQNYSSFIAGTYGGVKQVIGFDAGSLGGWDLATGKRLWSVRTPSSAGYIVPTPIDVGGKIFICYHGSDAAVYEFGKDGAINPKALAASPDINPEFATPIAAGKLVIGEGEGALVCLDAGDELKKLWASSDDDAIGSNFHVLGRGEKALVFGDSGKLYLVSFTREAMKVVGSVKLCGATAVHPSLVGTRIYVRDRKAVYCYELKK